MKMEVTNSSKATMIKRGIATLTVIVVLLLITGVYLTRHKNNSSYSQSYSQLNLYQLVDSKNHAGITINKPNEFTLQSAPSEPSNAKILFKPVQARFVQGKEVNGKQVIVGQLALNSLFTGTTLNQDNLVLVNQLMSDPKNVGYSAAVAPLRNYVNTLVNPNYPKTIVYKLSFEQAKVLSTPNIVKDAWYTNFTAGAVKYADQKTTPNLQGTAIEAFGKNGLYYVALYTVSANWQSNHNTWQQVINSLKIDQ